MHGSGVRAGGGAVRDQIQRLRNERSSPERQTLAHLAAFAPPLSGFRHPGYPWWARGLVILVLLYGISPLDLIPDVVPLLGWLDDATLLLLLVVGLGEMPARCCAGRSTRPSEEATFRERAIEFDESVMLVVFGRKERAWWGDCGAQCIGVDSTPFTLWV
jgi:uncharacterized membrane protein YkvA (DUF1232 family)